MPTTVVCIIVLLVIGLIIALTIGTLKVPDGTHMDFPADSGPNFIDVSNYAPKMQEYYGLFAKKCSRCHTLARPINSAFPPDSWRKYVQQMMRKAGSGLRTKEADQIVEFLVYDALKRRKQ